MYKRIAIAVDGSECASYALEQTLAFAASEESEVVLISVIPSYQGDLRLMGDSSILEALRAPYVEALDQAAAKAAEGKIEYKKILCAGEPGEEILNAIADSRADLVVVGKKASRLSDMIPIGSVSAKLLKLSDIDVLIMPCGEKLRLERILVAYDGSKHAERAARKACSLSLSYGSSYYLATIYEMTMENYVMAPKIAEQLHEKSARQQEPILRMLQEKGVRQHKSVVAHGDPVYRSLSDLARREKAGLAVLGSRGTSSISKILLGSVAARFIGTGTCPTLVVKQ